MGDINAESQLMRLLNRIGMERLAWSLRRLHCPVGKESLVLDVGSGGNPYPRANVLVDAYEETVERYFSALVKDRPMVFGVAERLPFKNKAFDFVIASHVLEHSANPEAFLKELMRVGKAGYIETPDAFLERINPYRFHRLEVTDENGVILIKKKNSWKPDAELVSLYEKKVKDKKFIQFLSKHPSPFYMRFYWDERIAYRIQNPEVSCDWPLPLDVLGDEYKKKRVRPIRSLITRILRFLYSQNRRNKEIDLLKLLACPVCSGTNLNKNETELICEGCGARYLYKNGIPMMCPVVT
ncbi:MAG: methyltransferase domain-containing protein [Pseudomonadota bacterium]